MHVFNAIVAETNVDNASVVVASHSNIALNRMLGWRIASLLYTKALLIPSSLLLCVQNTVTSAVRRNHLEPLQNMHHMRTILLHRTSTSSTGQLAFRSGPADQS